MNIVFLSPHFPPNYYQFCAHLRQQGVNVLGLADEPYPALSHELQHVLTEYYWVNNMNDYSQLLRACGYFTHKYGKIDRIDSLNEHWLETEGRLRADFNVWGPKNADMDKIKRKSEMKEVFISAGIEVARGQLVPTMAAAQAFIKKVGYPVVAKPDLGVGAASTYKITTAAELKSFFEEKPRVDYIMEEFVQGKICTFDGLTNREGEPVFFGSLEYSSGVMEVVNNDDHIYYHTLRQIPADLEAMGRQILKAFATQERFFHFEFFRLPNNRLVALEVNMRPPGGLTIDMFNYANEFNLYEEWANIVVHNEFKATYSRPYHCCHVGRKYSKNYLYTHEEVLEKYGQHFVHQQPMSPLFARAMGDYAYLVRAPELAQILEIAHFIHAEA